MYSCSLPALARLAAAVAGELTAGQVAQVFWEERHQALLARVLAALRRGLAESAHLGAAGRSPARG